MDFNIAFFSPPKAETLGDRMRYIEGLHDEEEALMRLQQKIKLRRKVIQHELLAYYGYPQKGKADEN